MLNCEHISNEDFLTNIIAFHSQQAIEKCFKAIIEEKALKTERIHNLFKLFFLIEPYLNFEVDINQLELLDKVYLGSRYPGEIGLLPEGKPTLEEAKEMVDFAVYVYKNTKELLQNII